MLEEPRTAMATLPEAPCRRSYRAFRRETSPETVVASASVGCAKAEGRAHAVEGRRGHAALCPPLRRRLPHQQRLQRPQPVHRRQAPAEQRAQAGQRGAPEAGEGVGDGEHFEIGGLAGAGVAGEVAGGGPVAAGGAGSGEGGGEGFHIAEAEVDALPGQRVHGVGGVADQDKAGAGVVAGVLQAQRQGEAWGAGFDCAEHTF